MQAHHHASPALSAALSPLDALDSHKWAYDPTRADHTAVLDLILGPPGYGKAMVSNSILLSLCLARSDLGSETSKLPLISKLDVGPAGDGLVKLLQHALPASRRDEAIYVPLQLEAGSEVNILDTQLGCRHPSPFERNSQQAFLTLAATPHSNLPPVEGMGQLIELVLEEAYRKLGDHGCNTQPKLYQSGILPQVDAALRDAGVALNDHAWWWEVVDALCKQGNYPLADQAQRHAVPLLQDLLDAARSERIHDILSHAYSKVSHETVQAFVRHITALIRTFPTLNHATRLEFGPARVIVLDIGQVIAVAGWQATRQTDLMYLLGRHILGRNLFLHPSDIKDVPQLVRSYHVKRFQEVHNAPKRLEYDEYHRIKNQPFVREQVERDRLVCRKHNLELGISSQLFEAFGESLLAHATSRYILGACDPKEADEIIRRFDLTNASADAVRHKLKGPQDGAAGSPFLLITDGHDARHEQILVASLGPVELWALTTNLDDVKLRDRLYQQLGLSNALESLSRAFARGTACKEIARRVEVLRRDGQDDVQALNGAIGDLVAELVNGLASPKRKAKARSNPRSRSISAAAKPSSLFSKTVRGARKRSS